MQRVLSLLSPHREQARDDTTDPVTTDVAGKRHSSDLQGPNELANSVSPKNIDSELSDHQLTADHPSAPDMPPLLPLRPSWWPVPEAE